MSMTIPEIDRTGLIQDRERVAEAWLAAARQPRTAAAYRTDIRAFFDWCDARGVDALRPARVELDRYRQHLAGRRYSEATRARKLAALSSFYSHGFVEFEELVPANPMERVRRPKVPRESTAAGLDAEEVRRLVAVADAAGAWEAALVRVLVYTGVRVAELCQATVADMFTERGQRTLSVLRKGGTRGRVVLPEPAAAALEAYLGGRTDGPLLVGSRGGAVSRHDVATALARLVEAACIDKPITPHSLRHTFATLSLDAGVELRELQQAMGHRNVETTIRYDRARSRVDRSPGLALARMLEGA